MTKFQKQLLDAAFYMTETITLSGVNIKQAKENFQKLIERALDKNEVCELCANEKEQNDKSN